MSNGQMYFNVLDFLVVYSWELFSTLKLYQQNVKYNKETTAQTYAGSTKFQNLGKFEELFCKTTYLTILLIILLTS